MILETVQESIILLGNECCQKVTATLWWGYLNKIFYLETGGMWLGEAILGKVEPVTFIAEGHV